MKTSLVAYGLTAAIAGGAVFAVGSTYAAGPDKLAEDLNLTEEQQEQLQNFFETRRDEKRVEREALTKEERAAQHEERQALRDALTRTSEKIDNGIQTTITGSAEDITTFVEGYEERQADKDERHSELEAQLQSMGVDTSTLQERASERPEKSFEQINETTVVISITSDDAEKVTEMHQRFDENGGEFSPRDRRGGRGGEHGPRGPRGSKNNDAASETSTVI